MEKDAVVGVRLMRWAGLAGEQVSTSPCPLRDGSHVWNSRLGCGRGGNRWITLFLPAFLEAEGPDLTVPGLISHLFFSPPCIGNATRSKVMKYAFTLANPVLGGNLKVPHHILKK